MLRDSHINNEFNNTTTIFGESARSTTGLTARCGSRVPLHFCMHQPIQAQEEMHTHTSTRTRTGRTCALPLPCFVVLPRLMGDRALSTARGTQVGNTGRRKNKHTWPHMSSAWALCAFQRQDAIRTVLVRILSSTWHSVACLRPFRGVSPVIPWRVSVHSVACLRFLLIRDVVEYWGVFARFFCESPQFGPNRPSTSKLAKSRHFRFFRLRRILKPAFRPIFGL